MYRKEKFFNGQWHYKDYPEQQWQPFTIVMLNKKIESLMNEIKELKTIKTE